ncbi:MAG TPA: hypothetical protein VHL14_07805 [Steroidobacteraceae bacterium]|jgi:hypothetical protein|nr:hypothetical protein [Steroidobacteraceae bacterium]
MKPSAKAALLSGLVFPGAGHIYLKRYATGIALIIIAVVATYSLLADAVHVAFAISDKITNGDVPLDVTAISGMVEQQSQQVMTSSTIATYALGLSWLIGIIDSYRIGITCDPPKK